MDSLTPQDYLEIYQELRGYNPDKETYAVSIRAFIAMINSTYSTGLWSKFQRGLIVHIPRQMKNELRAAVGLEPAPLEARDVAVLIEAGEIPFKITNTPNGHVVEIVVRGKPKPRKRQRTATFEKQTGDSLNDLRTAHGLTWNQIAEIAIKALETAS